jgi:hypothetical protein
MILMEVKNKYTHDKENGVSTLIIKQYKDTNLVGTYEFIIPIEFVDQVSKHTWNVSPRVSTPVVTLEEYQSTHKALGLNNLCPFVRIYTDATYKYAVSSKNKYRYSENDKHLYKTNSCDLAINNFTYHIEKLITSYEEVFNDYFEINYNSQGRKFINIRNKDVADAVKSLTGIKYHTLKLDDDKVYGFEYSENLFKAVEQLIQIKEMFIEEEY